MSQATASNTILPVTVACTVALTATMIVMICFHLFGVSWSYGQNDVVLPPPMILMDIVKGVAGFAFLLKQQLPS